MRATPILGRKGEDRANKILAQRAWFLPVVDTDTEGRPVDILIDRAQQAPTERALVMAGGFERRLGQLVKATPKTLLQLADRRILDRVLGQIEGAGVATIDIAVHYLAD